MDVEDIRRLMVPMFKDRSRWVREEAARIAVNFPSTIFDAKETSALRAAIAEYEAGLQAENDQPAAHMNLGLLYGNLGNPNAAIREYRTAIRLDPAVSGPRSNLARELDALGQAEEARKLRVEEAELIRRDTRLLPDNAFLRYQLGLLDYLLGHETEAEQSLLSAVKLDPSSTDFQLALTLLYEKQQRWTEAIQGAHRLIDLQPDNPTFQQILRNLQQASR